MEQKFEFKKGVKAIWRHLKNFKSKLIILTILGLVSAIANGSVPYVTGRFFDSLIQLSTNNLALEGNKLPLWGVLLGVWVIIQIISNNVDWVMDRMRRSLDTVVHFKIQTDGFKHLFLLPLNYHKNTHINGDIQKISMAGWRVSAILGTIINIVPQFLSIIIGIILATSINHTLALILGVGVLIYSLILIKILLPVAKLDTEMHHAWNQSWDDASASVQQIDSVKQASSEDYEIKKIETNLLTKTRDLYLKLQSRWNNVNFFQRTIVFLTQLTVFIFSIKFIMDGVITVGELVALNGYSMMFFGPFVALGYTWQNIQNGFTTAIQVEKIFIEPEEVYAPKDAVKLENLTGKIEFKNVSFAYAPDQPMVLEGIDLEVKAGQVVALVGESGVGKSTLISLISGYYFPREGEVLVDGIDTRKLNLNYLRQQIAVVPQEVALFNDTILNNIRYGTFDATLDDVKRVASEAHAGEFIDKFPNKYETIVGERGVKLSVGQKQRVAIARAMLREPAILILDEPTSALDAGTEKIITEALEKLMKNRTTFIIAHRLSTVRKADLILVFDKGKIVESGTHLELLTKKDGVYHRLHDYQIGLS